jgi:nucleotide-binding universal stress UspA family protein
VGTSDGQRIIVGVNASRVAQHAVLWAAQEARLRRLDLIIAHVTPDDASPNPDTAVDRENLINSSAEAASRREPSVAVGTLLLRGIVSEELSQLTKSAALLVVGVDSTKSRAAYGASGSLEDRLLVHASCPVVTVSRSPLFRYERQHRVVAIWTGSPASEYILTQACAEAALSDAQLTVVIVPESASSPGGMNPADHDRLRAEALVRSAVRARDVQVDVVHGEGQLASELSRLSGDADLLVLGCEHSDDRWSIRTGLLPSIAMRNTSCPVMFINITALSATKSRG